MRCFIAIDLSDAVRGQIADCIRQLEPLSRDIRWVPPANLHLTLKFLGEVPDARIRELSPALQDAAHASEPLRLNVAGTGVFPNSRRPNVLWVGMQHSPELILLHGRVEQAAARFGFPPEQRHFSPHLTIGRVKGVSGVDAAISHFRTFQNSIFGSIDVHEIKLMQSILSPSGATYETVGRYPLGRKTPA